MSPEEYFAVAKTIWKTLVPKSGQAETVQGELLRASEKLKDEAQRNGNVNFNKNCHVILVGYLRAHLVDENLFDQATIEQINEDLDRLLKKNNPYTGDDVYDRITNRIVDWYLKNTNPLPHKENVKLYC